MAIIHPTIKGLKVLGVWLMGLIASAILTLLLPILLSVITNNNEMQSIGAIIGIVIIMVIAIIWPLYILIQSAQEQITIEPFKEMIINVFVILFGIILLYLASYIFPAGAGIFETTFEKTIYWISTIIAWGGGFFIVPLFRIIKARGST